MADRKSARMNKRPRGSGGGYIGPAPPGASERRRPSDKCPDTCAASLHLRLGNIWAPPDLEVPVYLWNRRVFSLKTIPK